MKPPFRGLFFTGLLLVFFTFAGDRIVVNILKLQSLIRARQLSTSNQRTEIFSLESGADWQGTEIEAVPPPKVEETAIFLLRGATIERDLAFWNEVNHQNRLTAVRLVGYCGDDSCADFLRQHHGQPFSVIVYGEVVSSEALIEEDLLGNFLLRKESWLKPKDISWRRSADTPEQVANKIKSSL